MPNRRSARFSELLTRPLIVGHDFPCGAARAAGPVAVKVAHGHRQGTGPAAEPAETLSPGDGAEGEPEPGGEQHPGHDQDL
jgi:hypothetical protein